MAHRGGMKRAFEVETTIDRAIDEVWTELTDWKRAPAWMNGIDSMRAENGTEVGGILTFESRGKTRRSEIAALEPGRMIALDTVQGAVNARYTYRLEPAGNTTRARLTAELGTAGFPASWFAPLIRLAVRRTDSGQLEALRTAIEARR